MIVKSVYSKFKEYCIVPTSLLVDKILILLLLHNDKIFEEKKYTFAKSCSIFTAFFSNFSFMFLNPNIFFQSKL